MADRPRTVDASVRLAARRRERLRRRALRLTAVIGVLVLLGAAGWVVYLSPVFAVTTVTVTGTSVLTPESVRAAAKVPLGTPLARLDTGAVVSRVAKLRAVAEVSVTRSVPHTVKIAVKERTAVYALSSAVGFDLVDSSGVDYTSVAEAPKGLVVAQVAGDDERLRRDVATVVASLPPSARDRAVLVTATTPDSIIIELNGGTEVVWGSAESSSQKAQVLGALLLVKASVYDVSSPSHPTTKA